MFAAVKEELFEYIAKTKKKLILDGLTDVQDALSLSEEFEGLGESDDDRKRKDEISDSLINLYYISDERIKIARMLDDIVKVIRSYEAAE